MAGSVPKDGQRQFALPSSPDSQKLESSMRRGSQPSRSLAELGAEFNAAEAEASALMSTGHRQALRQMQANIRDPVGRLTIAVWLNRLQTSQPK